MSDEKTEEATPHKLRNARREGQVPKSQELSSSVSLFAAVIFLSFGSFFIAQRLVSHLRWNLGHLVLVDADGAFTMVCDICKLAALAVGPAAFAGMIASVVVQAVYSGVQPQVSHFKPDLNRLNPISGLKQKFSRKQAMEMLKTAIKATIVFYICGTFVRDELSQWTVGAPRGLAAVGTYFQSFWSLVWRIVVAQGILGAADALYQRWEFKRGLRMSKDEVKREYKQNDGDPHIKAKMRQMQRQMMKERSLAGVQEANVVIVNPTHVAVALKYNLDMGAPKVVAKGADEVARMIRELAKQHKVPIIRDKPLAWALYEVDVDKTIPISLYRSVATILAALAQAEADYAK